MIKKIKVILQLAIACSFLVNINAIANTCLSSYQGKSFKYVYIMYPNVPVCHAVECMYGGSTGYSPAGCGSPAGGGWEYENQYLQCVGNSSDCQFSLNNSEKPDKTYPPYR